MDNTAFYIVIWILIFIVGIILLLKRDLFSKGIFKSKKRTLDRSFVSAKWREIEELVDTKKPSGYKTAIIEADKLFDYVLKSKLGESGTMGSRLKKSQKSFSDYKIYQSIWDAHKVRNSIVHDADYEMLISEVEGTINNFKKGLKDLRAL